ncbi:MAG: hypothetical protein PVF58_02190 [Candidatus Methanofastidiosia archaeon]|jgi:hypothetical protein
MNRTIIAKTLVVIGILILAAGFVPLTRKVIVTEEKTIQQIEYKEETKTKQETYIEENIIDTETKQEILLEESISVRGGANLGNIFDLNQGDTIVLHATSEDKMLLTFSGRGILYIANEVGTDFEREFTIEKTGEHNLLYSSASVLTDIVIDFYIVRVYEEPIVEEVEKTRTVEYTEKVPYTVDVPIIEKTAKKETYTLDYLRYLGIVCIAVGVVVYGMVSRSRSAKKEKNKKEKKKTE